MHKKFTNHLLYVFYVILLIIISTAVCFLLSAAGVENESLIMVYIIGVLLSTVISEGYFYGLVTAVSGLLCYNYFFAYPYFTMRINDIQDGIMMCLFFLTAIIGGGMSTRYKNQTHIARENEKNTRLLYEITEEFVDMTGIENIVNTAMEFIYRLTGNYSEAEISGEIYTNRSPHTDTPLYYTIPITGKSERIGTMKIFNSPQEVSASRDKTIRAVVYQMALVLDRESIYTEREHYRLDIKTEKLKSTLLRSISHDIRTPLTGILGASTTIVENESVLGKDDITNLAKDIMEEAEWLILTVQNILNMTRLSEDTLMLNKKTELADDLILQSITRITRIYPREITVLSSELPEELIFVNVDGQLFVSLLTNLLDNAFKHSGGYTKINIRAYEEGENAVFEVSDDGCGIDEEILNNVFDGFVTVNSRNSDKGRGMGLGLSICRAIVDAHGGTIEAENREKGCVFRVIIKKEGEI